MTIKRILFVCALAFLPLASNADGFQGVDLGAGLSFSNTDVFTGSYRGDYGYTDSRYSPSFNTSNINANFNAGYNFKVDPEVIIGLQASLQPIGNGIHGVNAQIDQRYDFSILPGYLFTPSTLGYLKAGYSYSTASTQGFQGISGANGSFNGFVIGAGVKSFVYPLIPVKNLYGFAEYNYAAYDQSRMHNNLGSAGVQFNTNTGVVGIGYVFNVF